MARILITGASGFIGGYLVNQALENGLDTTAVVRAGSDRQRLNDPRLKLLELPWGNSLDMIQRLRQNAPFDWVLHNAGITKALTKEAYREVNVENTRRLVLALQEADLTPSRFLYVSSLAALGAAPKGAPLVQANQVPMPLTQYGESKREAETFLASLPNEFPWVVVQPTAVYGPWERDILTFIQLVNKGVEMTIGRQSQRLSFIHAADVANAVFRILESSQTVHQKLILSDGNAYTTEDLSAAVRNALGRKNTWKIRLPLGLVKQVATVSETIGRWQNKPSALNRDKIPELAAENWHCDAAPLLEGLQFKPAFDLYRGMEHSIEWYRKMGWI